VNGSSNNPPSYYAYMDDAWACRAGFEPRFTYLEEADENLTMIDGSDPLSEAYALVSDSLWFRWLAYQ